MEEGVYGELGGRERDELVKAAVRRCEGLVARVEGRKEEVVVEEEVDIALKVEDEAKAVAEDPELGIVEEMVEPEVEMDLEIEEDAVEEAVFAET